MSEMKELAPDFKLTLKDGTMNPDDLLGLGAKPARAAQQAEVRSESPTEEVRTRTPLSGIGSGIGRGQQPAKA